MQSAQPLPVSFTKIHGAGNDFIIIDDLSVELDLTPGQVQALCDRHTGIGADGVILIRPSRHADCTAYMHYINADGTLAQMCGNGVRCFAKYLVDHGFVPASAGSFTADTLAGKRPITFTTNSNGQLDRATVNMGEPVFDPALIPTTLTTTTRINIAADPNDPDHVEKAVVNAIVPTPFGDTTLTCVSMGNPHAVVFLDSWEPNKAIAFSNDPMIISIDEWGGYLEGLTEVFPEKTNVEFAALIDEQTIRMRVFERGVGETLACGTGACATAVAATITGRTGRRATLKLLGGDLQIEWLPNNQVLMTGPAQTVYEGTINL